MTAPSADWLTLEHKSVSPGRKYEIGIFGPHYKHLRFSFTGSTRIAKPNAQLNPTT
jgi:hypothetical protein